MSIEDANGCKRSLSVPGISVDVRRVKVSRATMTWVFIHFLITFVPPVYCKVLRAEWKEGGDGDCSRDCRTSAATHWREGE